MKEIAELWGRGAAGHEVARATPELTREGCRVERVERGRPRAPGAEPRHYRLGRATHARATRCNRGLLPGFVPHSRRGRRRPAAYPACRRSWPLRRLTPRDSWARGARPDPDAASSPSSMHPSTAPARSAETQAPGSSRRRRSGAMGMRGGFRGSRAGSLIHAGRGSVVLVGGGGLSRSLRLICWASSSTPPWRCRPADALLRARQREPRVPSPRPWGPTASKTRESGHATTPAELETS